MIEAEFRWVKRDGKMIRQFKPVGQNDADWADVSDDSKLFQRTPKRCPDTPDLFDGKLERERKKVKRRA